MDKLSASPIMRNKENHEGKYNQFEDSPEDPICHIEILNNVPASAVETVTIKNLKSSLEWWCSVGKIVVECYIGIIILYQIYWGISLNESSKFRRIPNKYILLIRIFLFLLTLFEAVYCFQSLKARTSQSAKYSINLIIATSLLLLAFVAYITKKIVKKTRKQKRSRSLYRLLEQENETPTDKNSLEDFDDDYTTSDRVMAVIYYGIFVGGVIMLLQGILIFFMTKVYRLSKEIELLEKQELIELQEISER